MYTLCLWRDFWENLAVELPLGYAYSIGKNGSKIRVPKKHTTKYDIELSAAMSLFLGSPIIWRRSNHMKSHEIGSSICIKRHLEMTVVNG